jgi:hypothetical protein
MARSLLWLSLQSGVQTELASPRSAILGKIYGLRIIAHEFSGIESVLRMLRRYAAMAAR